MSGIGRTNAGGGGGSDVLPRFNYTGMYIATIDESNDWKIKFLTSGVLSIDRLNGAKNGVDLFIVGGGGAGSRGVANQAQGAGGGGGYTLSVPSIQLEAKIQYSIEIGAGALSTTASNTPPRAGNSSAFGYTAEGGYSGVTASPARGGNGGSGGGGWQSSGDYKGVGGTDGGNGTIYGGTGQGTSTREFYGIDADATATLYSSGGSAGVGAVNATANTGDGGKGGNATGSTAGGNGGSGIVIIRSVRA